MTLSLFIIGQQKVDMDENERRKGEQRSSGERKTRDQEIEGFNVKRVYQDVVYSDTLVQNNLPIFVSQVSH